MSNMTEEEKKWFESLRRCLNKKPQSVQVLVHEHYCNSDGVKSEIYLYKKGMLNQAMEDTDDLMIFDPAETALTSFAAPDWSGNNHGY
ncbi:hypothetical protein [Shewanella xiamenensis]|uniref:hypothetical protein n=1 Tax=Shewanella xiamenensis TaxID=332186 RepID=UPI002178F40F|nr:hypothetical protein [Shewanella xiamenensis]BDQ68692.1 hypothetical protein NUITMVS2_45050 [Shewanella xiamenensis]GLD78870.1 hypothetical protein NUITMVS3_33040 [Shewanella xiamenensis]